MDLTRNRIPEHVDSIHLIAVCGTGMGALACMLKEMGYRVTGSDSKVYPPMSDFLRNRGIEISEGFDPTHLADDPDLVVIGNAVRRDNPEAVYVQEAGLSYCSMPQALNRFAAAGKKPILITGTHGKTTTSSIVAWILQYAGFDPSFMIGGILKNFNSNYRLGKGEYIVLEGDEYDTAYFDKGPKFLHYQPHLAVLTSVEFDHADIFEDLGHVTGAFDRFVGGLSESATLFAVDQDPNVEGLVRDRNCRLERYGTDGTSDWRLGTVAIEPPWTRFQVLQNGHVFGSFRTRMVGRHNLLNAMAAIGIASRLAIPVEVLVSALERFEGVKRRQEVRGRKRGITVMDDFAHHPTAVRETIRAVKPFCPHGRLIAVFEPRTNTSMRDVFQSVYPDSFEAADLVCVRKPPLLEKIPPDCRFSSEQLVNDLRHRGKAAHFFQDTDTIIDFICKEARTDDVVLVMSNGGFDNIHERLLAAL